MAGLDISEIVDVSTEVFAGGSAAGEFGKGLLLTEDSTLDGGGANKIQEFRDKSAVDAKFPAGSEPRAAASAWFGQEPYPKPLMIGRWNKAALVATKLVGGTPASTGDLKAVTSGSFVLGETTFTVNLSSGNNYAAQATLIQTQIRAATGIFAGATVAYANGRFTLTLAGADKLLGNGGLAANGSTGTLADQLGWSDSGGGIYHEGGPREQNAEDALANIRGINDGWYFLFLEAKYAGDAENVDVQNWAQSNGKMFFSTSNESASLNTGETASELAQVCATEASRGVAIYTEEENYIAASAAARLSSVDFDQVDSAITLNLQSMPGMTTSEISATQKTELDRKRANYYVRFGNLSRFATGATPKPGIWADVRYFLDWLNNRVQNEIFNLLASGTRIPATTGGTAELVDAIYAVLELGVRSGHLAPGKVSETLAGAIRSATGNTRFDGNLTNGYLVYATPIADMSKADREARKAPPIKIWCKGSSAFHSADIAITYED